MSLEKNSVYRGRVISLGTEGEGVVRLDEGTAFVPFCLENEEVEFSALSVKKGVCYGKLQRLLSTSPHRIEPPCPAFFKCGGCGLQHMDYPSQLAFKRGLVERALAKLGGIYAPVNEVVPCTKQFRYRNKLALPICKDKEGNTALGFYAPRSHRIVPVEDCLIQSEWVKDIISAVKAFSKKSGYSGYDGTSGELRQIVVREVKNKLIIALAVNEKIDAKPLLHELDLRFKDYTFLLNINPTTGNVIFSNDWRLLRGEGSFEGEECGIIFSAGAETFIQVNDEMRAKLYDGIIAEAADENATVIDLYSGGGLLTAMLAKRCKVAYGIEVVKEASQNADKLCERNNLTGKMINICGKVEDELNGLLNKTSGKVVVVCDPPRKGMERSVALRLLRSGADKIIAVSCNPATLARDLAILTCSKKAESLLPEGAVSPYKIDGITPFDMFPQTKHVETLVVLSRKN